MKNQQIPLRVPGASRGRALVVDDDPLACTLYERMLAPAGFIVDTARGLNEMREHIEGHSVDLVLLDLNLGRESGLDGLPFVLKYAPYAACFVLTSENSVESVVECMRMGATGYLTKESSAAVLLAEIEKFLPALRSSHSETLESGGLVGESQAIQDTLKTIHQIKDVDSTVLILGESGTGKEVVARTIHQLSSRGKERFDAINCAAIPETLLESELFGHKRGAFTDAKTDRKGIFETCSQGTLLLDEIGDMPLSLQTKLLRVLQERVITPIGGSNVVKIDTRVIAATHRTIPDEIAAKRFREDLYFRLSVVCILIPPLRQRPEDIPLLVRHFLERFNKRFDKDIAPPDPALMKRLMSYDWPGNVRELQNAIERGVVLSADGKLILENMLPHFNTATTTPRPSGAPGWIEEALELPLTEAKQVFERVYVNNLLQRSEGNISEAARLAGRYRADIYRILGRYNIEPTSAR